MKGKKGIKMRKIIWLCCALLMVVMLMSACGRDSIVGEWENVTSGGFGNFGFSTTGNRVEFTESEFLVQFAYNIKGYPYEIISEDKVKFTEYWDTYIFEYNLEGDTLTISDGRDSVTFCRVK